VTNFIIRREQNRRALPLLAALALGVGSGTGGGAEDSDSAPDVATEQRLAAELSRRELSRLTVRAAGAGGALLEATPESLLKWSNPDVGRVYGDVYVWTDQGRPAAVASIYRWYSPYQSLTIEFCSLSTGGIIAEREREIVWQPPRPGIEWCVLTGVDAPAASRPARLTQMKRIADRFAARLTDSRTDRAAADKVLRLLSRPVFRHGEGAAVDGALFAFVVGTDPELLLMVEADGPGWRYALSRINRDRLLVTLDEVVVRKFEYIAPAELYDTRQPYACYNVRDFEPAETRQP
jgi:hypothetical protein